MVNRKTNKTNFFTLNFPIKKNYDEEAILNFKTQMNIG